MIKSDVARHLLAIPLYPRTAKETQAALHRVSDLWQVEYACGLDPLAFKQPTPERPALSSVSCEPALKLLHPACVALGSGQLTERVYAEHVITFVRQVYELHFRDALKEQANMGRGAIEWVLDALWEALREKVEDGALKRLELDFTVIALRRL